MTRDAMATRKTVKQTTSHAAHEWQPAPAQQGASIKSLRAAAADCTACPLYKNATQTVFGEGSSKAEMALVGEQPGDQEDKAGYPFVGPAGKLLDKALEEAGIDRSKTYVTNVVKHFKWEPRGKRRIHSKPSSRDIAACKPWLVAELRALKPKVLVLLGSTAAQAVMGPKARVLRDRGQWLTSEFCEHTLVTVHPSSLLRSIDEESRARDYAAFVADLKMAANGLRRSHASRGA